MFSRFPFLKDQPNTVKSVVLNMCYQMGVTGVSKFKMFLKALGERDYGWASIEMLDSKWAKQTSNRAKELSESMRNCE